MKYELVGKIIEEFVRLRGKMFTYLIDDSSEYEESKGTKKCAIKRKVKFEDQQNRLEATQLENKINYLKRNLN